LQVEGYNPRLQPLPLKKWMTIQMYNADTELLFPPRIIPSLRTLRGATWKRMVEQVEKSGDSSPEKISFVLFMVKINGCASCNADSFRAMQGCTQCSKQSIRRLKEPDKSLMKLFDSSKQEVIEYQEDNPKAVTVQENHDIKTTTHKRSRPRRTK
jgi:hypothetical protein